MTSALEETIIDERLKKIAKASSTDEDAAFLGWVYSLLFDTDEGDIPDEDKTEGGQEKHIDAIHIDDDAESGTATISFLQTKNTAGFSSNSLILIGNGLSWVFEEKTEALAKLKNGALRKKIKEIRDLLGEYGPSGLEIEIYFATRGDTKSLSSEYEDEKSKLLNKWQNKFFASFDFYELGASELIDRMKLAEGTAPIKENIRIEYDVNKPSILQLNSEGVRSILCTISGNELARLASIQPENSIFEKNIRRHLGLRGKVNSEIHESCTNANRSKFFWFMNNGITMTCDKFDPILTPGDAKIKVENAQIVNGCQTSMTLRRANEESKLRDDVRVQLKIYETGDASFTSSIVLATNQQNAIKSRDLYSNHRTQLLLQDVIENQYGLSFERKANEFRGKSVARSSIINNEKAGQAYLAVVLKQPTVAKAQKYRVFDDKYADIFEKVDGGHLVLADAIVKFCAQYAATTLKADKDTSRRYNLGVYGLFHLSRVFGQFLFDQKKWPAGNSSEFRSALKLVQRGGRDAKKLFRRSTLTMLKLMAQNKNMKGRWNNYFKSGKSQRDINLYFKP